MSTAAALWHVPPPMPHGVTPATEGIVLRFREFLQHTFDAETLNPNAKLNRGAMWSREAASLTESFRGTPLQRATLFGELQLQMKAVDSKWFTGYDVGTKGEHLFTSNPTKGRFFSILDEGCYAGPQSAISKDPAGRLAVDYTAPEVKGFVAQPATAARTPPAPTAAVKTPAVESPAVETPVVKAPTVKAPAVESKAVKAAAVEATPPQLGRARMNVPLGLRLVVGLGFQVLIGLLVGLAIRELEASTMRELFRTKVDPDVQKGLKDASADADALGEDDPFQTVYANITVDLTYTGTRGGMGTTHAYEGLSSAAVHDVVMSREEQESQTTLSDWQSEWVMGTSMTKRVVRMTYSVEIPWDRPEADRIAWTAEANARRGEPVRRAVSGRPWDAKQTLRFVEAYVAATAGDPSRKALYDDAVTLRNELAREQRFGAASLKSAAAAANAGISARTAAAATHWSSNAQRENFVAAYVDVTRGVPAWRSLHEDASAYLAQMRSTPGGPSDGAPRRSVLEGALSR